MIFVD